jgi:xanthine dehydrogenase accessory factor
MLTAAEISSALKRSLDEGQALAIVTLMEREAASDRRNARVLVEEGGEISGGTLGDRGLDKIAARHAIELMSDEKEEISVAKCSDLIARFSQEYDGEPLRRLVGGDRLLFEISRPPLELIVCGGGHVGQAVARAARFLGFNVTVIDDRAEFASREKFPDPAIRLIADDFIAGLRSLKITPAAHLVIVTRGHKHDEICLREVIGKPARYIGMIGSRRRTTTIREHLRREGIGAELLRGIRSPIGLDIGAQTPEEIAISILGEIVLVRRGGSGKPKSEEGPMARAR